ncbi:hypothetical protein D3C72_2191720 [compost metagenome]
MARGQLVLREGDGVGIAAVELGAGPVCIRLEIDDLIRAVGPDPAQVDVGAGLEVAAVLADGSGPVPAVPDGTCGGERL